MRLKKFFVALVALVLVLPVLLIPVSANTVYYGVGDESLCVMFFEVFPDGIYDIQLNCNDFFCLFEGVLCRVSPGITVEIPLVFEGNEFTLTFSPDGDGLIAHFYDSDGRQLFDEGANMRLTLVELAEAPSGVSGISDLVTSDMLSGVLDEMVSLLPVVFIVIISFIGIRKGISFLQNFLHNA